MHHNSRIAALTGILLLGLLILVACGTQSTTPSTPQMLLGTPAQTDVPCQACALATLVALQTQEKIGSDAQAAATAEIMRANAQATLNAASSTLSVAQTQEQNNANIIAAQIAATAAIVRANAQATLDSAGATQNAALTQDAIRQTQMADLSTSNAQALLNQQYQANLAAGTQTAIANTIATQTQSAAATSQWYTDQERQRDEQQRGPIAFIWTWCFPGFLILLAGLIIWGTWRSLKIKQANQRILELPVEKLPAAPEVKVLPHHHHTPPYLESEFIDDGYHVTTPDDQVRQWLDEVKDQLQSNDEKDKEDDDTNT